MGGQLFGAAPSATAVPYVRRRRLVAFATALCLLGLVGESHPVVADVWSTSTTVSNEGLDITSPQVSSNADGTAVAVWLRALVNDQTNPEPCDNLDICIVEAASFDPVSEKWGPPTRLSKPGENADQANVIIDESGVAIAVWRLTSVGVIQASVFNGKKWAAKPEIVSLPEGGSRNPQLALGPAGSFKVVWYRPQAAVNVIEEVQYAKGRWSAPSIVATEPEAVIADVATNADGDAVAVWSARPDVDGPLVVRASRFTHSWSEPVTLSALSFEDAEEAQVALDPQGNAFAAWQQSDGENTVVRVSRFDAHSGKWSIPQDRSIAGNNAVNPRLASDDAGNVTMLWRGTNDSGFSTVQSTRYTETTGMWNPVDILSSSTHQSQAHQLAVDSSGQVAAVWRTEDDFDQWTVQSARFSPGTNVWGAPRELSEPEPEMVSPATDVDADGNVIVIWPGPDAMRASRSSAVPGFVAVSPVRVFDTRPDQSPDALRVVDKSKVGGATELAVDMSALPGGITPAAGFLAVALNVTIVDPDLDGYLTVYPCGSRSEISNVNFAAHQIVSTAVIAPVSSAGMVCFFSNTPVHILADLNGYFPMGSGFTSSGPQRLFDTRPASSPNALLEVSKSQIGGDVELRVPITALLGPTAETGVSAVSLNVTVANPSASGFVTVYPCGTRSLVSNVNFVSGQTASNSVIAPLSPTGELCFFSSVNTDIIVDIAGWFASESSYTAAATPSRVFDTRPRQSPDALLHLEKGKIGGPAILRIPMADLAGITPPVGIQAVSLNVTVTAPEAAGFITVYPCDTPKEVSSINFVADQTVANAVVTPLSRTGDLCLSSSAVTHLVVDINGFFATSN